MGAKSTPAAGRDADKADQNEAQSTHLGLRNRLLEEKLRPEKGTNITGRNHRIKNRQFAVFQTHHERNTGSDVKKNPGGELPVHDMFQAVLQGLRPELQKDSSERANQRSQQNEKNRADGSGTHACSEKASIGGVGIGAVSTSSGCCVLPAA